MVLGEKHGTNYLPYTMCQFFLSFYFHLRGPILEVSDLI